MIKNQDESGPIVNAVADVFMVDPLTIHGRGRSVEVSLARQVVMYMIRMRTDYSLEQTGAVLGGRTPATISHGFQSIADLITWDDRLLGKIKKVGQTLDNLNVNVYDLPKITDKECAMEEGKVTVESIEGLKTSTKLTEVKVDGETEMHLMTTVSFAAELEPDDIAELHRLLAAGHRIAISIFAAQSSMSLSSIP